MTTPADWSLPMHLRLEWSFVAVVENQELIVLLAVLLHAHDGGFRQFRRVKMHDGNCLLFHILIFA